MLELKLNEDEQELLENFLETLSPDEIQDVAKKRGFDAAMSARFWQYIGHTDTPPDEIVIEADLDELERVFRETPPGAGAPGQ